MYRDKFVLSVLRNGSPLREFGPQHDRKVSMPFDSEYMIRLRNKNDKACSARVFIDGTDISNFGDFIIQPGAYVDLERFLTESMSKGKRFKFVSLNHSDVNDPHSSDNGLIKVEFRLARTKKLWVDPQPLQLWPQFPPPSPKWGPPKRYYGTPEWLYMDTYTTGDPISDDRFTYTASNNMTHTFNCSVEPGATVEGGYSGQSFSYGDIDVEESPSVVLKLKIVGVKDKQKIQRKKSFCTNCGNPRREADKYHERDKFCGNCGRRF